jgi:hypothetical protein
MHTHRAATRAAARPVGDEYSDRETRTTVRFKGVRRKQLATERASLQITFVQIF